mmetsp:Transcript_12867/g.27806  ORF Transcript_12867/g.27806 Transcript_12867/m.27806 type:complete len:240 (+) Transcript_12867:372-1091(+)
MKIQRWWRWDGGTTIHFGALIVANFCVEFAVVRYFIDGCQWPVAFLLENGYSHDTALFHGGSIIVYSCLLFSSIEGILFEFRRIRRRVKSRVLIEELAISLIHHRVRHPVGHHGLGHIHLPRHGEEMRFRQGFIIVSAEVYGSALVNVNRAGVRVFARGVEKATVKAIGNERHLLTVFAHGTHLTEIADRPPCVASPSCEWRRRPTRPRPPRRRASRTRRRLRCRCPRRRPGRIPRRRR